MYLCAKLYCMILRPPISPKSAAWLRPFWIVLLSLSAFFVACEKEVEIDLPPIESELVVECYLTPGYPYVLSLSETVSYFELLEQPFVSNALVTITHNGIADTLQYLDSIGIYISPRIVAPNDTGAYYLYVNDTADNRTATAVAKLLPMVPIDTVIYFKNDSAKASILTYFSDDSLSTNYYRYYVARLGESRPDSLLSRSFSDLIFSGQTIVTGTAYDYPVGNEVLVRIYNISREYYDFLETAERATFATQGAFSRPARLISNIMGGTGIFTVMSYDERRIMIE
jgi:hypothetical protein